MRYDFESPFADEKDGSVFHVGVFGKFRHPAVLFRLLYGVFPDNFLEIAVAAGQKFNRIHIMLF
jgi:hypothetical protein